MLIKGDIRILQPQAQVHGPLRNITPSTPMVERAHDKMAFANTNISFYPMHAMVMSEDGLRSKMPSFPSIVPVITEGILRQQLIRLMHIVWEISNLIHTVHCHTWKGKEASPDQKKR